MKPFKLTVHLHGISKMTRRSSKILNYSQFDIYLRVNQHVGRFWDIMSEHEQKMLLVQTCTQLQHSVHLVQLEHRYSVTRWFYNPSCSKQDRDFVLIFNPCSMEKSSKRLCYFLIYIGELKVYR